MEMNNILMILIYAVIIFGYKKIATTYLSKYYTNYRIGRVIEASTERKFGIAFYKFQYYLASIVNLFCAVREEKWIFDTKSYLSYEKTIPNKFKNCYNIEMAFYIVELITIINEPRKKDFKQMILHHFSTLIVMCLSFNCKLYRFGIGILLIHNISDPLLELSKTEIYLGNQRNANIGFIIFACVFLISRLYIYPKYLVISSYKALFKDGTPIFSIIIMAILLFLQVMHVIWTKFIIQLIIRIFQSKKPKDTRE